MGQTLGIPIMSDSGTIGLDFFLNSRSVSVLQRSGVDIDHILNPYSFPRITTQGEKKREIRVAPQIVNLPTHVAPKSIAIVPKIIQDSTGTPITTFVLQLLISATAPSLLTVYFIPSQPDFTTQPHHFEPQHQLLQPIELTIHPCLNELVEITLPQCFVEFLAFQQLCQSLEAQGTDIATFFGACMDQSIQPTLVSRVLAIQNIPVSHYLSIYSISKSILAAVSHMAFTVQTLIPVAVGPKIESQNQGSMTSSLLASTSFSANSGSNDQPPTVVTEWVTLNFQMNKITLVPAQLRQVISNYEVSGDSNAQIASNADIHPALTIPARDSVLYKVCNSLTIVQNTSTHHIHLNQECIELLDLFGFRDNSDPEGGGNATANNSINGDGAVDGNDSSNNNGNNNSGQKLNTNGYTVEPIAATTLALALEPPQIATNTTIAPGPIDDSNSNVVDQEHCEYPFFTKAPDDCIVCMTATATHVIYPCRHLCLCSHCAQHVIKKADESSDGITGGVANTASKCPMCRQALVCIFNLSPNGTIDDVTHVDDDVDETYGIDL